MMKIEDEITSRANQHVQRARAVREGKEPQLVFVEGLRLSEDIHRSGATVAEAFITAKFAEENERGLALISKLEHSSIPIHLVAPSVLESVADTKSPSGIVMLIRRPGTGPDLLLEKSAVPLLVIAHRINNPANAGAIIRTAEAAGATGAILTQATADIFSPKGLRGAMGSSFRVPLWAGPSFTEAIEWCRANGIATVGAAMESTQNYTEFDWTWRTALLLGEEGHGLSAEEINAVDQTIAIPMQSPVESLNVAVAAGVVLYEARRQRTTR